MQLLYSALRLNFAQNSDNEKIAHPRYRYCRHCHRHPYLGQQRRNDLLQLFTGCKNGDRVKLIGQLVKDRPVEYNPEKDPNYLAFYLKDEAGEVRQVVLHAAKPQDFSNSNPSCSRARCRAIILKHRICCSNARRMQKVKFT